MPLTPPPDYTKAVLAIAIGVSVALLVGLYTRTTLPHVGDLQHSLPHGGLYKDGTKQIAYGAPLKLNSVSSAGPQRHYVWAAVLALCAIVYATSRRRAACNHICTTGVCCSQ
ncbi:triple gene block protein 2 [Elderberry carlavirus C]|uniref:Movement protein TGB2 n=1 Tax=Elderberry carlavirus C TaxID=1569054 RepID=A0A0A7M920_9VIRU|nr:triple gene block protein 2 [Elderberry carlavirus C]AIZ76627.1 triple gene block protein 2 [Elderberry carlavirus C]